jgi:DNA-binding response OmpR family regulator
MKLLLVEDEPEMASALREALGQHNILLDHAGNLAMGTSMAEMYAYDLLLLDRQLPDGDGLTMIPKLRAKGNLIPILVLTAKGSIADRVDGLDQGADDYLAKPFAIEELLARLRALVRRPANLQSDVVHVGRLAYDYVNHDACVQGVTLDLTRREVLVLEALLRRFGRMVPRSSLMESVFAMEDEVQPNALDTQISRLRRKLADVDSGLVIHGVRGLGYYLGEAL